MILKKYILIGLLAVFGLNSAQAQSSEAPASRFNIHTNPVMWLVGFYSLGADVALTEKLTLGGSYNHINFDSQDFDNDNIEAKANGFDLRMQYFLNQAFQDGWYLTGFGSFNRGEVEDTVNGDFAKFDIKSLGVTAGYFWRCRKFHFV